MTPSYCIQVSYNLSGISSWMSRFDSLLTTLNGITGYYIQYIILGIRQMSILLTCRTPCYDCKFPVLLSGMHYR